MKLKSLTIASILAAITASICCIGPGVGIALGLSTFGLAAAFESVRPYMLALTFGMLAVAFYRAYWHRPDENCATGVCEKPISRRATNAFLWLAAALVLLFAGFPTTQAFCGRRLGHDFKVLPQAPLRRDKVRWLSSPWLI